MAFGIYIHIPFCLQKCSYCDFVTMDWNDGANEAQYLELLLQEIRQRSPWVGKRKVSTIYFGGGTPSLLPISSIVSLLSELEKCGLDTGEVQELSIEINPGTMTSQQMSAALEKGFTRFSVGAQSFNDQFLNLVGRKHTAEDTRSTLRTLESLGAHYSFDLLFGLPGQTVADVLQDISELSHFSPDHLSAYCLTVPKNHPLSQGQPKDQEQVEMFLTLEDQLKELGLLRYELSNYARPGRESKHNQLYWTDQEYWGLGVGAHSYFHNLPWGLRYWNPSNLKAYKKQTLTKPWQPTQLPSSQLEKLSIAQSLTDFCHTSFRLKRGLRKNDLEQKFSKIALDRVASDLKPALERGWVQVTSDGWTLSQRGLMVYNQVLQCITYLSEELIDRGSGQFHWKN